MRIESEQVTTIPPSKANEPIEVNTKLSTVRRTLHFNYDDASREKDNLMYKELGKYGLSLGAFAAAGVYGVEQIVDGFNHSNVTEVGNGAVVVLLASFLLPLTKRFYHDAMVARIEKKAIDTNKKLS